MHTLQPIQAHRRRIKKTAIKEKPGQESIIKPCKRLQQHAVEWDKNFQEVEIPRNTVQIRSSSSGHTLKAMTIEEGRVKAHSLLLVFTGGAFDTKEENEAETAGETHRVVLICAC